MGYCSIDFETRSLVDLRKCGIYRYAEDPSTDVLCMAFAFGEEDPVVWVPGQKVPIQLHAWAKAGKPLRAFNATFERVIWNLILVPRYGFPKTSREQWYCTAAEAAALALPRGLGESARIMKATEEKDEEGHALMLEMCKPSGWTEDEEPMWRDTPGDRARLAAYCAKDVETERALTRRIRRLSDTERQVYLLDQTVNDRGVAVDLPLIRAAEKIVDRGMDEANARLAEITGGTITAVTQTARIQKWLDEAVPEVEVEDAKKSTIRDLLARDDLPEEVVEVLTIRKEAGKSSNAKLAAMLRSSNRDGRVRGMLLYHGAGTGRWSGKGAQPQNYPRGEVKDVEQYIPQVLAGDYDGLADTGHHPLVIVSSMLRSMFVSGRGKRFISADFSQVEARVLGWLAGEPYGDKEYERMAAAIFGVPLSEVTPEQRQLGKNTVLGCGFQMGWKTFQEQAWERDGAFVPDHLAQTAVDTYRTKKAGVTQFWWDIEAAAMAAVQKPGKITHVGAESNIRFVMRGQFLWCVLPSGRALAYALPAVKVRETKWGPKEGLQFWGVNGYTKRWEVRHAYGGFLTENVVQATARDIMAESMLRVEGVGYPVVLTVHDEILAEVPERSGDLEEFLSTMAQAPAWARNCPLAVEGWEGDRYRK
jgi:DNA polymerase bacteriophage-type